jgi:hypothetical protein
MDAQQPRPPRISVNREATIAPGTRLSGRQLVLARVAWGTLASLLVGLFALLLPAYWTQLRTVCAGATCAVVQPSPASAQALHQLGLSVAEYATWTFAITIASTLFCLLVGGVIVWRKSDDWMALVAAVAAVALGTLYVTYVLLPVEHSTWQVPTIALNTVGNAAQFLFIALFPGGRFVPAWTRWVLVGWIACGVAYLGVRAFPWAYPLLNLAWFAAYAALALAQIYRYRRVSTAAERQQATWVVFGWLLAVGIALGVKAPELLVPSFGRPGAVYALASGSGYILAICVVCGAMGMAVLRSHLFDIDVLINKALVYGLLTTLLAGVYAGLVIGLESLVGAITGKASQQPVIIVASTLAIAALFQPLRRRIQGFIDRRFYRRKYDAARTLAAFGRTIRTETDLGQLSAQLLGVVEETMQPNQVSLWLVDPMRHGEPADAPSARVPNPAPSPGLFPGSQGLKS